jgi:chromosome segregation ATPase
MSVIAEIIDTLENKIGKLFLKIKGLEKNNQELYTELKNAAVLLKTQSKEIEDLKTQLETLKIANALLGSDDNKRDTKLKINSIIREIDYCIAQLTWTKSLKLKYQLQTEFTL